MKKGLPILLLPFLLVSCSKAANLFDFLGLNYAYLYDNTSLMFVTLNGGQLNFNKKILKVAYKSEEKEVIQSYLKTLKDNGYSESDDTFSTGIKSSLEINLFANGDNYFIKNGFTKNNKIYQLDGFNSLERFDFLGYCFSFDFANADFYQNNEFISSFSLNSESFYFNHNENFTYLDLRTSSLIMVNEEYGIIPQSDNTFSLYKTGQYLCLFDYFIYECSDEVHLAEYLNPIDSDKVTLVMKYEDYSLPIYFDHNVDLDYGRLSYLLDWFLMEKEISRKSIDDIKINGLHNNDGHFILSEDSIIEFIHLP